MSNKIRTEPRRTQERLLEITRAELRAEQVLQMRPDVPACRRDIASQNEMSMRAEIHLRLKGLAYHRRIAMMAANSAKPTSRKVEIDSRVVLGLMAILSWPWLG